MIDESELNASSVLVSSQLLNTGKIMLFSLQEDVFITVEFCA